MIRDYVKQSGDYSLLHEWIPLLRIRHVTKYRNGYLDSVCYEHAGENEREVVMGSLSMISSATWPSFMTTARCRMYLSILLVTMIGWSQNLPES